MKIRECLSRHCCVRSCITYYTQNYMNRAFSSPPSIRDLRNQRDHISVLSVECICWNLPLHLRQRARENVEKRRRFDGWCCRLVPNGQCAPRTMKPKLALMASLPLKKDRFARVSVQFEYPSFFTIGRVLGAHNDRTVRVPSRKGRETLVYHQLPEFRASDGCDAQGEPRRTMNSPHIQ